MPIITPSGTYYHDATPPEVIQTLEWARNNKVRIRIALGDAETGRDWQESYDVTGYIGRSTGSQKVPLMIHSRRSLGGGAILTANIVKIEFANKRDGGLIWQHPGYHV